eukprot:TRINITY_DN26441_c0_g1_i1.p1 TRINITY_DN26441_c0_g1~~TRINITY_DN26441_c0_g1_i1.p1  ORF type:complete len:504 (+),score=67.27 TRINITY_DN26441_c0_g1_i1:27-1514(+)
MHPVEEDPGSAPSFWTRHRARLLTGLIVALLAMVVVLSVLLARLPVTTIDVDPYSSSLGDRIPRALLRAAAADPHVLILRVKEILSPERVEGADAIAISGGVVVALGRYADWQPLLACMQTALNVTVVDEPGLTAIPGFVDVHVHAAGGGGEKGPASRTPVSQLSDLATAGVTTIVGILGTDGLSHSPEELLTQVRGLNKLGITAKMWTGNYRFPVKTLTGDVMKDIIAVEEVLGVGELAISDHRGSSPSFDELSRLVSDIRVGALLAGKQAVLYCHMGDGKAGLKPLMDVVQNTPYPITHIWPTHCERNELLVEQALDWVKLGGFLDFTTDAESVGIVAKHYRRGIPLERMSFSTDAYGSLPEFDSQGRLVGYTFGFPSLMWQALVRFWTNETDVPRESVLALFTRNPANFLQLKGGKGRIVTGGDADVLLVDLNDLTVRDVEPTHPAPNDPQRIRYVLARGRFLKSPPNFVARGMFESAMCPGKFPSSGGSGA